MLLDLLTVIDFHRAELTKAEMKDSAPLRKPDFYSHRAPSSIRKPGTAAALSMQHGIKPRLNEGEARQICYMRENCVCECMIIALIQSQQKTDIELRNTAPT